MEADKKAGAVGIGEVGKGFGLSTKKADGSRLKLNDPELKPVWAAAARLKLPVFIHTADPQEFFRPVDYTNERWLEQSLFPERRYPQDRFPSFEQLMAERDSLFKANPQTTFVAAHLGWHANDLGRLGKMFDEMPNVLGEMGAVLYDIGRQPRAAHDFFVNSLRQGQLSARGVSVLLACARDARRLLRLLPRLPRLLEAVRHRPARRGTEEGVLPERPSHHGRPYDGVAEVTAIDRENRWVCIESSIHRAIARGILRSYPSSCERERAHDPGWGVAARYENGSGRPSSRDR
jgi:hypothetical protein